MSRPASHACAGARDAAMFSSCSARATSTERSASCGKRASVPRVVQREANVVLARYTTIGTGGPARWFARPETVGELQEHLRWARDNAIVVEVIGLGSNLLVDDNGVDALVLKLAGELASA